MSTLLDQACERCGILPEYYDIWGGAHPTSEAAKRALLEAMGVPAASDADLARSLDELERREWSRALPPVVVVREPERPYRVPLVVAEADLGAGRRWKLRQESGGEIAGEFSPAALEEVARVTFDGVAYTRRTLVLAIEPGLGYHRFVVERADGGGEACEMSFIVAPPACYQPPAIHGDGRAWGIAAQLYGVRSERNWGIGDFGDLRHMLEFCADSGAGSVLLNPLHAMFPDAPEHASPYSPSNRAYFNTLYLDVEEITDFGECEAVRAVVHAPHFQARLRALRAADQVDYRGVADAKAEVLRELYAHFRAEHLARESARGREFRAFQAAHGNSLRSQALFEALQTHFRNEDGAVWGWPVWPEAYRTREAPEVSAFGEANLEQVEYFEYLQWQASLQLRAAGTRSWELGLGVGVMLDLAIGVAEGGAATWMCRDLYAFGASAGAPPDEFNRLGQDWGLPPWIPHRLKARAYEPFIELIRANMRDSGALRLDHVMGLFRLFWVARGLPISQGAYVAYPFRDLLGILALESQRNRCLVVGEDLGTVPEEVRAVLQPMEVLSTRLLYFERQENGRLAPPGSYPANAVAAVTTHDLPTLAGYWRGLDIDLREQLRLFPDAEVRNQQVIARSEDRAQLLVALEGEQVLPPGGVQPVAFPELTTELAVAVYTYLGRAPSKLLLLQLEDGFGVHEQPNLPGTVSPTYPCWRLKIPINLEEWRSSEPLQGIMQALRQERPVTQVAGPAGAGMEEGVRLWIPRATYRLQLNRDFKLPQAMALLPYLDALGISHCYLSPILKARPGSRHGYDITDHSSLNPEIASAEDFEQFVAEIKRRGMGQIMDLVPNHMGINGADNAWWLDVLENGPASRYATYFDIDWYSNTADMSGRVLLPVLGEHYGAVLDKGELKLVFDPEDGAFSVFYYEHRFPVDPREYPRILGHGLERLQARLGAEDIVLLEFQALVTTFGHLPARDRVTPEAVAERSRDKEVHKHRLAALYAGSADVARFIDENLAEFNGIGQAGANFDLLHELLQSQAYRLAFWRVAADEINYRRFFDINDLAALRMDNPEVFEATHRLLHELLGRGYINGLRIDHPDGLYAPKAYFERLQAMAATLMPKVGNGHAESTPRPLYLIVEKILAVHEHLPESWAVHGTTGYDFAAACTGLFVDASAADAFTRTYQGFIRARPAYEEMVRANKHLIMQTSLAGELQVLATQLTRLAKEDRCTCDFTLNSLRSAIAEIVASFPVYRTYVTPGETSADDVRYVDWAVGVAKKRSRADPSIFDFVRDAMLGRLGRVDRDDYREAVAAFAMKFQQYSSPVTAKAVEDTTFYQYNRLVALNEVGAEPQRFGVSLAAFHRENQERSRRWPHAMLASSTHDTKRSEDVRARLCVLSEVPELWHQALSRWSNLNRSKRRRLGESRVPSRNDEYLLYQTLLGIWPFDAPDADTLASLAARLRTYMLKAVREGKTHSSWISPDTAYEDAVGDFVSALLSADAGNLFLRDFAPFQAGVARAGAFNSLSQLLLKLASPGVPDVYQGCEMWDFSLVDPDNRRPVDYARRQRALQAVRTMHAEQGAAACTEALLARLQDGEIKLYLVWRLLAFRRAYEALFREGDYVPLKVHGARAEQICAFSRQAGGDALVLVVPRLIARLVWESDALLVGEAVWGDTWIELPPERVRPGWVDVLTERGVDTRGFGDSTGLSVAETLATVPFAVLHAAPA
ncbi:Alpha amylase, catalytic subdomain [Thiobacillus denitrificans ATCC 25259]|uniref:4-alpha-glucanotransferase n=1 Tax=Thiobacillus denitrificans (strain ATCC 25259 / T1) TaxID=292415 RepID=Q3SJM7_THIDA|nr:malto-oligosyltrehalose synthase [Thiobacillus denitrificans]AAZ97127.1 Alpha amylase, catalytic subdomain [Thiobacillus denitrificans ATCC 25259]